MSDKRIRVAVIFGGRSSEHPVSCVSAGSVLRHIDRDRFDVTPIGITTAGAWVQGVTDPDKLVIANKTMPSVDPAGGEVCLSPSPASDGAVIAMDSTEMGRLLANVDVVFPILHGPYGEDGTIQGLLELSGVPYVGPGVLASAAGMDKEFTKKLLAAEGLPVGRQIILRPGTHEVTDAQREAIGLPAFVKPARGGSSIGISRITSWDQLADAIAVAREHDPKVIIEAGIVGREVECGVLEFPDGRVEASVIAEIRLPDTHVGDAEGGAFYDFETKYINDVTEFDVPANLSDVETKEIQRIAVEAFRALDCQGLARVDFFSTADGPVINEINTMPGFTSISLYPRVWAASGVEYSDLISTLIDTAIARGTGLR
ncbi:D-alanine--D-alanine ligase family protein [Hoyosella rhizosphaerae]|uniref:D-alanine--D-alanine ligase n=1 Tax=Hoyosella rhizosphaerae TaxID=1755582 RepID=A0A916TZ76_9ACTN|nr:D-alanine--D-alanine ligase family protein [Hoyosella rhizosphaerae]GGC52162.1 D-alanine--D-alanine ligase [Hoyosella rhizosphaerae]